MCNKPYHKKCTKVYSDYNFLCHLCTLSEMPFFDLDDSSILFTLKGINKSEYANLELLPSFSIKTLLDKLPGNITIQTDDFTSDSISSKYYTPIEFLENRSAKNNFSVLHINIASLQAHIDDLKQLLALLDHSFDVIGISETKLQLDVQPVINIEIEGYILEQSPTKTHFEGVALYVKKSYDTKLRKDLSSSTKQIGECVFIEIEQERS